MQVAAAVIPLPMNYYDYCPDPADRLPDPVVDLSSSFTSKLALGIIRARKRQSQLESVNVLLAYKQTRFGA